MTPTNEQVARALMAQEVALMRLVGPVTFTAPLSARLAAMREALTAALKEEAQS